jgi:hypothetical protein
MQEVRFSYGVIGKSLKEQANDQGFELKNDERFEKIRKAITMCGFHVATESQVNAMIKKLHNKVIKNLTPVE